MAIWTASILCLAALASGLQDDDSKMPYQNWYGQNIYINGEEYPVDRVFRWRNNVRYRMEVGQSLGLERFSLFSSGRSYTTTVLTGSNGRLSVTCGGVQPSQSLKLLITDDNYRYKFNETSEDISITSEGPRVNIYIIQYSWRFWDDDFLKCVVSAEAADSTPTAGPDSTPTSGPTPSTPQSSCRCGVKNGRSRIIGGTEVSGRELPWQVYLSMTDARGQQFQCGGSVVSRRHVVTAAHCTHGYVSFFIIPGADNIREGSRVRVKRAITHPDYDDDSIINDIAVLELDQELDFDESISPICLPDVNRDYYGEQAIISGYGLTTDFTNNNARTSTQLLKVDKEVGSPRYCVGRWGSRMFDQSIQVCDVFGGGRSSCQGDSGGPMQVKVGDNYHLVGVVSFGGGNGCLTRPTIYAKAQAYVDWVQNIVTTADDDFCPR